MHINPNMGSVTEAEHRALRNICPDKKQELRERMKRNHDMILELVQNAMQKPRREK